MAQEAVLEEDASEYLLWQSHPGRFQSESTRATQRDNNLANEITDITNTTGGTWAQPAHDAAGNMTTIPQPADPTVGYTATYDAWNRLVKLVDDATEDTVQETQYDGRTFRTVRKNYTSGSLTEARHFYYSAGWQVVEERTGSASTADRQFVWGLRYIDDLALRDRDIDGNNSLDERLYALQDVQFNTVAVIAADATVAERYTYTPFGQPIILNPTLTTVRTNSEVDIEVLFTGQRYEAKTGFHLFRMRWFDSVTGRFVTRDPIGYPDGMNMYAGWFVGYRVDTYGMNAQICSDGAHVIVKIELSKDTLANMCALCTPRGGVLTIDMHGPGWTKKGKFQAMAGVPGEIGVGFSADDANLKKSSKCRDFKGGDTNAEKLLKWMNTVSKCDACDAISLSIAKQRLTSCPGSGRFVKYQVPGENCISFGREAINSYLGSPPFWLSSGDSFALPDSVLATQPLDPNHVPNPRPLPFPGQPGGWIN